MKTYTIKLQKTIVVSLEAQTRQEAVERAIDDDDGFDGAWDRAEPTVEVLEESEE